MTADPPSHPLGGINAAEASIANAIAAASTDEKVVAGKGGWLFLANDTNDVIAQHAGLLQFSERELRAWRWLLERRIAWIEERGARYFMFVPPNAHAVYEEHLPDEVDVVADRPVVQLRKHLHETGSMASIIYPLRALRKAREKQPVYVQTDSHWNEMGAFIGYRRLMEVLRDAGVQGRVLPRGWLSITTDVRAGDLGRKVTPAQESEDVFAAVTHAQATYAYDNRVRVTGRRVEYRCEAAPPITCLIHGDSFSENMLHFVAESFGRVIFAQMSNLDYELVIQEKPDVVIGVLNERFLLRLPCDTTYPTLADLEADKRARGQVYPPREEGLGTRVDRF